MKKILLATVFCWMAANVFAGSLTTLPSTPGNYTALIPSPILFSENFVDMGGSIFRSVPAVSFGYSEMLANVTVNSSTGSLSNISINESIGLYYEGVLADGVNPGDRTLLWSDGGLIASLDGLALKAGPQISGIKQGDGFFFGFTWLAPIPNFMNNLGIKL